MQIASELKQHYHVDALEDVRVIRDRHTSKLPLDIPLHFRLKPVANLGCKEISRQLGFLRFPSLEASREFLEQNYPTIYLYGKSASHTDSRGVKVRIAYSREREDRNRVRAEGEWTCKIVSRTIYGFGVPNLIVLQCTMVNYATRQRCFRCQAVRTGKSILPPILIDCSLS